MRIIGLVAAVLGISMASCGSASSDGNASSEENGTSGAEQPSTDSGSSNTSGVRRRDPSEYPTPSAPWAEMDAAARAQYMSSHVAPYFKAVFQEFDAERYADFGCATCHGPNATARGFEMPNPSLFALHPTGSPEQQQMAQDHPRMVRLMFNHVVPPMRAAVQGEDFNADTGEGFSCYTCHPAAETSPADSAPSDSAPSDSAPTADPSTAG